MLRASCSYHIDFCFAGDNSPNNLWGQGVSPSPNWTRLVIVLEQRSGLGTVWLEEFEFQLLTFWGEHCLFLFLLILFSRKKTKIIYEVFYCWGIFKVIYTNLCGVWQNVVGVLNRDCIVYLFLYCDFYTKEVDFIENNSHFWDFRINTYQLKWSTFFRQNDKNLDFKAQYLLD